MIPPRTGSPAVKAPAPGRFSVDPCPQHRPPLHTLPRRSREHSASSQHAAGPTVPTGGLGKSTQTYGLADSPTGSPGSRCDMPPASTEHRSLPVPSTRSAGVNASPEASPTGRPLPQRVVPALFDVRRAPPPPLSCPDAAPTHRGGHNAALASTGAADPRFPSLPRHPGDATHLHSETSLMQACVRWTASLRATGPTSSAPLPPGIDDDTGNAPVGPPPQRRVHAEGSRWRPPGGDNRLRPGARADLPACPAPCPAAHPSANTRQRTAPPRVPPRAEHARRRTAPDPAPRNPRGDRCCAPAGPSAGRPPSPRKRKRAAPGAALFSLDQAGLRLRRRPGPARRSAQRPRARAPPDRPEPCGPPRSRRRPAG